MVGVFTKTKALDIDMKAAGRMIEKMDMEDNKILLLFIKEILTMIKNKDLELWLKMAVGTKFNGSRIRWTERAKRYKKMDNSSKYTILMENRFLENQVKLQLL